MKVLVLYNPFSGKGSLEKDLKTIKNYFINSENQVVFTDTKSAEELEEIATKEAGNFDLYIVVGGDGTIHRVVNGIMKAPIKPQMGVIPRGTANDFAKILGMDKDIIKSLDIITKSKAVLMDIGKINDEYFTYGIAVGKFSSVSYDVERKEVNRGGYIAYLKSALRKIGKKQKVILDIYHDLGHTKVTCSLAVLLNGRRLANFNLRFFSKAKLDDGLLEMGVLHHRSIWNSLKILLFFMFSGRVSRKDINFISSHYVIKTENDVVWNVDGEKGPTGSVSISLLKKALRIHASVKAIKKYFTKI